MVRACEASIRERIRSGEVTDKESLSDTIHEEADNACFYTSDCWVLAYGLPDREDAIEEGLCEPGCVRDAVTAQAYCSLRYELSQIDFSDAFAVAEDSELEQSEGGES